MTHRCGHPRGESEPLRRLCLTCIHVQSICRKVERVQARINAGLPIFGREAAAEWL